MTLMMLRKKKNLLLMSKISHVFKYIRLKVNNHLSSSFKKKKKKNTTRELHKPHNLNMQKSIEAYDTRLYCGDGNFCHVKPLQILYSLYILPLYFQSQRRNFIRLLFYSRIETVRYFLNNTAFIDEGKRDTIIFFG